MRKGYTRTMADARAIAETMLEEMPRFETGFSQAQRDVVASKEGHDRAIDALAGIYLARDSWTPKGMVRTWDMDIAKATGTEEARRVA